MGHAIIIILLCQYLASRPEMKLSTNCLKAINPIPFNKENRRRPPFHAFSNCPGNIPQYPIDGRGTKTNILLYYSSIPMDITYLYILAIGSEFF
jgi:hypothetical protein